MCSRNGPFEGVFWSGAKQYQQRPPPRVVRRGARCGIVNKQQSISILMLHSHSLQFDVHVDTDLSSSLRRRAARSARAAVRAERSV